MVALRRRSEDRQVELTDAALHIIATQGIAALTTRSLAEHVGLSSGAIFRHFSSLEALLDAVVARVETVLDASYPPAELPPTERLSRFIEARSSVISSQVGILRLVLSEQFLLALPKGGSERLGACVRKTRDFIGACLREGQTRGEVRTDIEPGTLAIVVMGAVQMLALSTSTASLRGVEAGAVRRGLLTLLAATEPAAPRAPAPRAAPAARARTKRPPR